jgi:formate dehydrogenase subunit beta
VKTNTILPVKEGDVLGALRGFLGALLENQIVDALLVPLEIGQGRSLAQTLVQDPAYLSGANPFSPVMPVNSATLVSQLTGDKPTQKVGVVLRSCEIRALIELVKLQQANLDNLTIIGVDCLGTYEVDDYARLIGEMEGPVGEKGAQVVAEMRRQLGEGSAESSAVPLRTACQICELPTPVGADITVGLIGVATPVRWPVPFVSAKSASSAPRPLSPSRSAISRGCSAKALCGCPPRPCSIS